MGYYTRYGLEVFVDQDNSVDIVNRMLDETEKYKFYPFEYSLRNTLERIKEYSNNYNFELESSDETKWYEHEDEMKELSKIFPNTLFKLHGEGEENGDIWDKYFLNGKIQECYAKLTIDPFDKDKLK